MTGEAGDTTVAQKNKKQKALNIWKAVQKVLEP